jgi:hypothetical protein
VGGGGRALGTQNPQTHSGGSYGWGDTHTGYGGHNNNNHSGAGGGYTRDGWQGERGYDYDPPGQGGRGAGSYNQGGYGQQGYHGGGSTARQYGPPQGSSRQFWPGR